MGSYPFAAPALSPAAVAAALAGQVIPGGLSLESFLSAGGSVDVYGGVVDVETTGNGLQVAEGANAKQGIAVIGAGGSVTVANASVTANSRIFLAAQVLGTVAVPSAYAVSARVPGVSFTILASVATDTSTIAYEIFEPG